MNNPRIAYPTDAGGVAVIIPAPEWLAQEGNTLEKLAAKDVPPGKHWRIVDAGDIPADEQFWASWEYSESGPVIAVNIAKAKAVAHDMRRAKRAEEFKPHDDLIMKQIPGADAAAAEAARAAIRAKYAAMQTAIDAATTPEEIKVALEIPA